MKFLINLMMGDRTVDDGKKPETESAIPLPVGPLALAAAGIPPDDTREPNIQTATATATVDSNQ